ncbi:MAG: peptidoglycan DD-metalloendopeptidase family protein [Pseudomonadota bacterium]
MISTNLDNAPAGTAEANRRRPFGGRRRWSVAVAAILVAIAVSISGLFLTGDALETTEATLLAPAAPVVAPAPRRLAYGIDITDCQVMTDRIKPRQNLSDILATYGVGNSAVMDLVHKSSGVFKLRSLRPNRPYCLIIPAPAKGRTPSHLVYEINQEEYVVFSLEAPRSVTLGRKPVTTTVRTISGIVDASLWQSMAEQGGDSALMAALSGIYAWSVDFHYLRAGDTYRVVFEERYIDDKYIGIGRILAAVIHHGEESQLAFRYEDNDRFGYFDENGRSLEKAFLKAPVKYSHISSRYSRQRLHPVLGTVKAHLGTDYAAPVGTPVMSTGDGTVLVAGYDSNNGKYIKVRHNETYATQYLHLSRFATGIRKGASVSQGDVIGYVGATGMATGPHLCYRFWKNGCQLDPLTTPMPASRNLSPEQMATYRETISPVMAKLTIPTDALTLAHKN